MKSLKIILATIFITSASLFFFTDSVSISVFFNSHHNEILDLIFYCFTYLGLKETFILAGVVMYFVKKNKFLAYPLSFINFSIVVQFLKRIAFAHCYRPSVILPQLFPDMQLSLIPYVTLAQKLSFPSGHTTLSFSLVILLIYALDIKNILVQIFLVTLAVLVGVSRIYLLQHFFRDVYFGALIGSVMTFCTIYVCEKYDLKNKEPFKKLINWIKF